MVSYGGGANSTALLIGLHQHRIPVDLILFADTGAEHPHTYAYLEVMDSWLKDHGMPPITRVYKTTRDGKRLTLEDECLQSCSLPSIAYGFKRCSLKHKIGPQEMHWSWFRLCAEAYSPRLNRTRAMRGNLQTFPWLGERFLSSSSFSIEPFWNGWIILKGSS